MYRKAAGREAKLACTGRALIDNRHGPAVGGMVTQDTGTAECDASEAMLKAKAKSVGGPITVGEDKAYYTAGYIANLRAARGTPHVTQNDA